MPKNGTKNGSLPVADKAPLLFSCRLSFFMISLLSVLTFMFLRLNINFGLVCMVKRVVPNNTITISEFNNTSTDRTNLLRDLSTNRALEAAANFHDFNESFDSTLLEEEIFEYEECQFENTAIDPNSTVVTIPFLNEGVFEWSKETQGAILGSFFYGFIFTQIPGGWISDRFGGKTAFISSIAIMSSLSLLSPLAATFGPGYLFGIRVLQGLSHGATLPCMNVMATNWSPPNERGFLLGIAYAGFSVGMAVIFPVSAFLCKNFGWEYIFYATGGFGLAWCVLAYFLIFDWPEDHPRISKEELQYLQHNRTVAHGERLKVPWKKIACSLPVNVIHITHFCGCFTFYIFVMYLPTFMKEVLKMSISQNGLYSSLPFVGMLTFHLFAGTLFDFIRRKNVCTVITLRKIFNTAGMLGPTTAMLMLGFLPCTDNLWGMLAVSTGQAFVEFAMMGGYLFSIFDLAPRFAGILTGISNTFGNLPGFMCPVFVAYMTPNGTRREWLMVFYITAVVNLCGAIIYLLFGKSTLLPWAVPKNTNGVNKTVNQTEMKVLQEKLINDERKI